MPKDQERDFDHAFSLVVHWPDFDETCQKACTGSPPPILCFGPISQQGWRPLNYIRFVKTFLTSRQLLNIFWRKLTGTKYSYIFLTSLQPLNGFWPNLTRTKYSYTFSTSLHASRERLPFRTPGSVPLFETHLCSDCWDVISRTFRVFTRLFTLNTPRYFLDFAAADT